MWENEALDLPEDLPATTNTKAVQIKYTMTVRHEIFKTIFNRIFMVLSLKIELPKFPQQKFVPR